MKRIIKDLKEKLTIARDTAGEYSLNENPNIKYITDEIERAIISTKNKNTKIILNEVKNILNIQDIQCTDDLYFQLDDMISILNEL